MFDISSARAIARYLFIAALALAVGYSWGHFDGLAAGLRMAPLIGAGGSLANGAGAGVCETEWSSQVVMKGEGT